MKPAMKENIMRLLRSSEGRVNIKARTHEKVSFNKTNISCLCTVLTFDITQLTSTSVLDLTGGQHRRK